MQCGALEWLSSPVGSTVSCEAVPEPNKSTAILRSLAASLELRGNANKVESFPILLYNCRIQWDQLLNTMVTGHQSRQTQSDTEIVFEPEQTQ